MALKDALKLISNKLAESFHVKPYDPTVGRIKLAKLIRSAKQQQQSGNTRAPGRSWRAGYNEAIEIQLKLNGHVISLPDPLSGEPQERSFVAAADFAKFCEALATAVEKGELDDEIRPAMSEHGTTDASVRPVPRASGTGQGRSGPRQSRLPARRDGLAHRVPYGEGSPHPSYVANKNKTYWRSPEQVDEDTRVSDQKKATQASKK